MKKKNRSLVLILPVVLVMMLSCKKDLSLAPLTFTTTDQTNAALLNNQLAGIYSVLEVEQMYGWGLWGYFTAGNDEGFGLSDATGTATQALTASFRSTSQDASYLNFWKNLYAGIERANVLLSVVNQPVMDSATRANIKGQALFLRAYYFYLLVSNFGDVPYKTQLTSTMGNNFSIPATPSKQIYDSIISDMTAADSLVQNITTAKTTTVVTKSAVEGILVRVCMSAAGYPVNGGIPYYQQALNWAGKIINSNIHSLYTASQPYYPTTPAYARVFINNMQDNLNDNNLQEDMWDAAFLSNGVGTYASLGYSYTQQLGAIMGVTCPSNAKCTGQYRAFPMLYNLYGAGDLRRDWAISSYVLDSNNVQQYNMGITFKISPGKVLTPIDTIYINGVPHIKYDTAYYGSGATAVVDSFNTLTGTINHITITNGGSGYFKGFGYTLSTPSLGNKKFAFTYTTDPVSGAITGIKVTNPGIAYVTLYDRPVGKWRREYEISGNKNPSYTSCEFPIIRYADVLLMYAEADLMVNGGTQTGLGYFNQVRRRAYGNSSAYDAPSITLDSIKAERSRELCFEGVRRNDLKRWGISNWVNTLNNLNSQLGIYNLTSPPPSTILTASQITISNFVSNPQKFAFFPIPSTELGNEGAIYQNYGW